MARCTTFVPEDVRETIRMLLQRGEPATLSRVTVELATSRSAVHRVMSAEGLRFDSELRQIRAEIALRLLVGGRSVGAAAVAAGVCPDHLRQLFKRQWGLLPGEVSRVMVLVGRVRAWRGAMQPEFGTRRYFRQRIDWREAEDELWSILGEASEAGPLRRWAADVLRFARRPDYRRGEAGRRLRESRAARRRADAEILQAFLDGLDLRPWRRRAGNGSARSAPDFVTTAER